MKMMDFALKMMHFALKMMDFGRPICGTLWFITTRSSTSWCVFA